MFAIDLKTVIQTLPLVGGCALAAIYSFRCHKEKRKIDYEIIFLSFTNSIALTSALLLVLAAYIPSFRNLIPDLGIYIAVSGIVLGIMSWQSTKKSIFFDISGKLTHEQDEIDRILAERNRYSSNALNAHKDLLILVDIQNDFFKGGKLETHNSETIIEPLTKLLRCADSSGCTIILTKDWHPEDHKSFQGHGGKWPKHCVRGTPGAKFHDLLKDYENRVVVEIGADNQAPDYSAFDDPRMDQLVADPEVRAVFVAGIALEYCVLGTCLDALKYGKPVIALEPYIRAASTEQELVEEHWSELTSRGVIRAQNLPKCS